jgi:hypothetical protein
VIKTAVACYGILLSYRIPLAEQRAATRKLSILPFIKSNEIKIFLLIRQELDALFGILLAVFSEIIYLLTNFALLERMVLKIRAVCPFFFDALNFIRIDRNKLLYTSGRFLCVHCLAAIRSVFFIN